MPYGTFGIELEFSILESDGSPSFGAAAPIVEVAKKAGCAAEAELGSFQIELNPGIWPLGNAGIDEGLKEISKQVETLVGIVNDRGLMLCASAMLPMVTTEMCLRKNFYTNTARYRATTAYFAGRKSLLEFEDGTCILLPGEAVVACINSIHVNIAYYNEKDTVRQWNILNMGGYKYASRYLDRPQINRKLLTSHCTTMRLFEEANGELSQTGNLHRVGFPPVKLKVEQDYFNLINQFKPIVDHESGKQLDIAGTVYFWVRLRRDRRGLRLEYRAMDMTKRWDLRVRDFLFQLM